METVHTPTCLVLVMGLPGAGKTSLVHHLRQEPWPWTSYVVTYDSFLPTVPEGWKEARAKIFRSVENLLTRRETLDTVSQAIFATGSSSDSASQRVIYLDDNFYFKSMRYEYYKLCRTHGWSFVVIYVHVPVEVAIQRNDTRAHPVPMQVIQDMSLKMEPPAETWEQFSITVNGLNIDMEPVRHLIEKRLKSPVSPLPDEAEIERSLFEARMLNKSNIYHIADTALRKMVTERILSQKTLLDTVQLRQWAQHLNDTRSKVLNALKSSRSLSEDPVTWACVEFKLIADSPNE